MQFIASKIAIIKKCGNRDMQEPQHDHVVACGGVPDAGAGFAWSVQVVFRNNPRAPVGAFVESAATRVMGSLGAR